MRLIKSVLIVVLVVAALAPAQVVIRSVGDVPEGVGAITAFAPSRISSGASFSFFHMPSDPLGLLQQKQIQEELELSDDQRTVVEELQKDIQRQTREIFEANAKFGGDAARLMETAQKTVRKNVEKELEKVLSPKQLKRLGQLEVQMSIKNRGVHALTEEKLASALGVADEQKEEIRERGREMQEELRAEIAKLRERLRNRLIKELLDDDQLVKLEELSGEEYEVQRPNVRRVFGR